MGRFDKLEFNSESDKSNSESGKPSAKMPPRHAADEPKWLDQAEQERRCGHYENALRIYSRALEEDRSLINGWVGQVQMLVQLGESVEAELWSGKALELFPNNGELLAGRAQAHCRLGDMGNALACCDGALKQPGQSAYRWTVRGELMLATRSDTYRHCFEKAEQIDKNWLVPLEIALIGLQYGAATKTQPWIRRAVEGAADQPYVWYVQGQHQLALGLDRQARQSFERCLQLSPQHADAQKQLQELATHGWSPFRMFRRWLH